MIEHAKYYYAAGSDFRIGCFNTVCPVGQGVPLILYILILLQI